MTRRFAAPRVLVFRAMTEPELIARWWGRTGSTTEVTEFDFRPGGHWRFVEHSADGISHAFRGEFLSIEPPGRFVQTFEFEGAPGQIVTEESTLRESVDVTTVRTVSTFGSADALEGMISAGMEIGAGETYDRLEAMLPEFVATDGASDRIVLRRFFDAPRAVVFAAWTDARHLDRWWGPDGFTTRTESHEARSGGAWSYTMTAADGTIFPNFVWFDEVIPPERIVYRHAARPEDEASAFHVTVTFTDLGDVCGLVAELVFQSVDACRAVKSFGAVEKGYETHAKLSAYLRELE
jgi:uncharacterized protein YndB with AHSA1/START domain